MKNFTFQTEPLLQYVLRCIFSRRYVDHSIIVALMLASVAWAIFAGKDLNWDQLNYHFYIGFALLDDRLTRDFLAANGQTYLNPLAYVPFSWMILHQWNSLIIVSALALFHGLNLVLVYLLVLECAHERNAKTRLLALSASVLALISPIFLTEAGTTFADITTSVLLLLALLLTLRAKSEAAKGLMSFLVAGILIGSACGMKLTNAIYPPAFAIQFLVLVPYKKGLLRSLLTLGAGILIGFAVTQGYWSWHLWHTFGDSSNSIFNYLIGSPSAQGTSTVGSVLPQRFMADDIVDAATLPFRMMQLRSWVYIENLAPDLRFAAFVMVLAGLTIQLIRRIQLRFIDETPPTRKTWALLAFFLSALVLWIATSSNGRYGISVSILCGPAVALLASVTLQKKVTAIGLLIGLTVLQCLYLQNAQLHWTHEKWTKTWYEPIVPGKLQAEPFLYVSIAGNSNSYLAGFVNPASAFTNPIGQVSFEMAGKIGERFDALFDRYRGRTRILARVTSSEEPSDFDRWMRSADTMVARLGFKIDPSDCLTITTSGEKPIRRSATAKGEPEPISGFRTCALIDHPYERQKERAEATAIVDAITRWCPKMFGTTFSVVDETPDGWIARYQSTEATLMIHHDQIILTNQRASVDLGLGHVSDWVAGRHPNCEMMPTNLAKTFSWD